VGHEYGRRNLESDTSSDIVAQGYWNEESSYQKNKPANLNDLADLDGVDQYNLHAILIIPQGPALGQQGSVLDDLERGNNLGSLDTTLQQNATNHNILEPDQGQTQAS
jgi:hypothetical protein